jgi:hypothetical protein
MRLYLDIDGVLLGKRGSVPEDLADFLKFATTSFECYWLTTHCKGDARTALRYLAGYFPEEIMASLGSILPTNWDAMKTEGIDFKEPFVWLDDQPFESEKRILEEQDCSDRLWIVDLNNPRELLRIRIQLAALELACLGPQTTAE